MMRLFSPVAFLLLSASTAVSQSDFHKVRVGIVARITDIQFDQFRAIMEQENPNIDASFSPKSFEEADAVVFIMNSWDEADDVPGAKNFPEIWERLSETNSPTTSRTFKFTYDGNVPMTFVFYSLDDAGTNQLVCFAKDAAVEITRQDIDPENRTLSDCAKLHRWQDVR